jgi:hypothetical protein
MPHAFKATPDHPAVDYLVRLHADIGGRIKDNQAEAKQLATAIDQPMTWLDAVLSTGAVADNGARRAL